MLAVCFTLAEGTHDRLRCLLDSRSILRASSLCALAPRARRKCWKVCILVHVGKHHKLGSDTLPRWPGAAVPSHVEAGETSSCGHVHWLHVPDACLCVCAMERMGHEIL